MYSLILLSAVLTVPVALSTAPASARAALDVWATSQDGFLADQPASGEPAAEPPAGAADVGAPLPAPSGPAPSAHEGRWQAAYEIVMLVGAAAALVILRRRGVLKRAAFVTPARDVAGFSWGVWLAGAIAMFLALSLGASGGKALTSMLPASSEQLREGVIVSACHYAVGVVFALVAVRIRAKETSAAGFRWDAWDTAIGLGAFLLTYPIVATAGNVGQVIAELIARFTHAPSPANLAHATLRNLAESPHNVWWWATVAGVVLAAPIVEEVLYRGFLQSAFVRAFGSTWAAILLTSALFTLSHINAADVRAMGGLFVLSVAMGVAFERTGRLGVSIAMHSAFNAFNIAMMIAN